MTENPDGNLTPLEGLARLAAMIYYYLAGEAMATCGREEGTALVGRAVWKMGEERGRRIRVRVDEAELEPTLENLWQFYDLPIGQAWESTRQQIGEGRYVQTFTRCPFAALWREAHVEELAIHYCAIDMAIIAGYNPDIRIQRTKSLLQGDDCCVYEYIVG